MTEIAGSADAVVNVIIDGIEHVPNCRLLLEELIKFVMMHEGSKHINAVDSIVANAISTGPDIHSLSAKDREDLSCLYLEFIDLCGTNHDVRKAWNRHIKLFPHLIRTTYSYEHPTAPNQLLEMAREARKRTPSAFPNQPSNSHGSDHLTQLPVPEQEPLPPENHVIQLDEVVAEQSQQKEDANSAQEGKQIEDVAEAHESKHDLVHQSGDDVSGAFESTQDMVCHSRIDSSGLMELNHDLIQQSEEATSGQIEPSHEEQPAGPIAPSEFLRESSISPQKQEIEVDNELEKYLKPIHLENLSPSYQEKESQDLMPMELQEHDVCQKLSRSDGDILELGPSTEHVIETASPKSSPTAASARNQNELDKNDSVNPSSSTSHQSPTQRHSELQREVPSNSGEDSCQDFMTTASCGASPNLHEHSHDLQQQDSLQKLRSSAEMGAQMQVRNGSQGGNQHHSGVAQEHVTTSHAGPVQDVQRPSYVSAPLSQLSPQPVLSRPQAHMSQYTSQTSEQNGLIQNSQAYNQMLQIHFQQQLLQQQYQQQMLQMQHPYFQLQQQQLYQQQQQHNQPQQLMFQHQHYLQQSQQLQQPPYQAEQQQYLLYLQQLQQQLQQQQLQPGQQEQYTQLEGQEHQRQLQQFYQSEGNAHQQNQQGYQLLLQQYQVQQQQQYQQLLQQHQLQQQQGYQELLLQHQLQQQQITSAHNQSSSNYQQGQGLKPSRNKDAAGPSEPLYPQQSPEGMLQPQNAGERRHHVSPHHHQHSPQGVPASRRALTSLSPTLGD